MTSSRRIVIAALLFAAPAAAQRTAQDIASARQLYNDGIALRDKGDTRGALEKFRAAHALGNTPLTGIELCRTHAALRQPVEAREVCLGVGRIPPLAEESSRSKDARTDAANLAEAEKARIASLRLRLRGVPAGAEAMVTVDGGAVPTAALGEPRAVNPGPHVVTARVGQGAETRITVDTQDGETKDVDVLVQAPPAGAAPPPPPVPSSPAAPPTEKKSNTFGTVALGVGAAGLAIGTIAGIVAMSKESDLSVDCAAKVCGRDHWDDLDTAKTWGTVSTVFFVFGVAAGAVGLVSTLSSKASASAKTSVAPVLGLGGGGLRGSF